MLEVILNGGQIEIIGTLAQVLAVLEALKGAGIASVGKCRITLTDQPVSREWIANQIKLAPERIVVVNT